MSNTLPYGWTAPTPEEIQETADAAGNLKKVLECILYNTQRRDIPPTELLRIILEVAEAGLLLEAEPLVIVVDGASTTLHSAHASTRQVVKIEYDRDLPEEDVTLVPQGNDDQPSPAWVTSNNVYRLDPVIAEFARMFAAGEDIPEDYDV